MLSAAAHGHLPAPVQQALKAAKISERNVAVVVRSVDGGAPTISHNAAAPMNPASVMKLLTTFAALDILGPGHTWKTEAIAERAPVAGRLAGDLFLRGSGDPKIGVEQFSALLRSLRVRGLRDIDGDLVLDRSAFALAAHDPAAFDQRPLRPYNAGPDALLVNFKSLSFVLSPDTREKALHVWQMTPDTAVRIDNRVRLTEGDCGDWRDSIDARFTTTTLEITGTYAAACGEKTLHLAPFAADVQVEGLFRALWGELGGTLKGRVRPGRAPADAILLAMHESPPLFEAVRDINKYSNNVMARQLLLALAPSRPATVDAAIARIRRWLEDRRVPMPELVVENGAGLSRQERISADSLARLLAAAWASPVMAELMSSLPILGRDGTLKKRHDQGPAAGRAHLKTGYLENVRSLAGFVLDTSGRRWIVVALINDANAPAGKAALDTLVAEIAGR